MSDYREAKIDLDDRSGAAGQAQFHLLPVVDFGKPRLLINRPSAPEPKAEPKKGARVDEAEVPAEFREGGKPDGDILTTSYLASSPDWLLLGPYLSKHSKPGGILTTWIKVKIGKQKVQRAYLFTEVLELKHRKLRNESKYRP
jgi:hypothetical protein